MSRTRALLASFLMLIAPLAIADEAADWFFFDLGNTIVDTRDWDHVRYVPGAIAHVEKLKAEGRHVGLIINIPEEWGRTCRDKYVALTRFLDAHWVEPEPFAWQLFDRVILPPRDDLRKPLHPFIFYTALAEACPGRVGFVGENADEVRAASGYGMAAFHASPAGTFPGPGWLERGFRFVHPDACDFRETFRALPGSPSPEIACTIVPRAVP